MVRLFVPIFFDKHFGCGRNGVKHRGFLRFESGCYNVDTLRVAVAALTHRVHVIECMCTPSMKSSEYYVRLVYDANWNCLIWASNCDCPDGDLFCSHMVGAFLIVLWVQTQKNWTFDMLRLRQAMPEPIRTIQGLPIFVDYVYNVLFEKELMLRNAYKKTIGALAKEFPGYTFTGDDEDPEIERMSRTDRDYESKSICICTMALDLLQQNKMRASESGSDNVALPKLTSAGIESFNSDVVNLNSIHERTFVNDQAIRHENCFNLYKLGGFLPPTLIEGFVSDKSQTANSPFIQLYCCH